MVKSKTLLKEYRREVFELTKAPDKNSPHKHTRCMRVVHPCMWNSTLSKMNHYSKISLVFPSETGYFQWDASCTYLWFKKLRLWLHCDTKIKSCFCLKCERWEAADHREGFSSFLPLRQHTRQSCYTTCLWVFSSVCSPLWSKQKHLFIHPSSRF